VFEGLSIISGEIAAAGSGGDIGRDLFRLVAKARLAGLDPELELRGPRAVTAIW
jgi:hypothetical protein